MYCKLGGNGYKCYLPNNEECGVNCQLDGTNCELGCCDGVEGTTCCPNDNNIRYQKITNYYGCYNKTTKIGCYNENVAKTSYICELNGVRCATGCNSTGTSCNYGSCDSTSCPTGKNFQQIIANYYGCYDESLGLGCYKNGGASDYACYKGTTQCGTGCGANYDGKINGGTSMCGTCTTNPFTCPTGTTLLSSMTNNTTKGCVNSNGITCLEDGTCYASYGAHPNQYRCGTGCNLDGTGCSEGVCNPNSCTQVNDSWVYDTSANLYKCMVGGDVVCNNGVCSINGHQCGTGFDSSGYGCTSGVCRPSDCPDGVTSIRQATDDFYGCYNAAKNTICYPYSSDVKCMQNNRMVGTGCQLDGTDCICAAGTGRKTGDAGITADVSDICLWCPVGTCSSVNGTTCGGTRTASNKTTQICLRCPKGQYNGHSGYTSCYPVPIGNYTVGTGNVTATQCSTGYTTLGEGYYYDKDECDVGITKACGCQPAEKTCTSNADCASGTEFCWFANNKNGKSSGIGECKLVSAYDPESTTVSGKIWYRSKKNMNWWSGQNWCKAQGYKTVGRSDIGCGDHSSGTNCTQSSILQAMKANPVLSEKTTYWLEDYGNANHGFYLDLSSSYIASMGRYYFFYILCQ